MSKRLGQSAGPGIVALLGGVALVIAGAATAAAQAAPPQAAAQSSIVTLESPRVADYWISATRQPGGVIVFDGYAPDEATRQRLSDVAGADVSYLKLGRGASQSYQAAVDFGLAALGRMSEGRFALRDNIVTLTGTAQSAADYQALTELVAAGLPQGLVLARSEIEGAPPPAAPAEPAVAPQAAAVAEPVAAPQAPAVAVPTTPKIDPGQGAAAQVPEPSSREVCRAEVAAFTARNPILFQSGAAVIVAESAAAIDELAAYLLKCPDADIDVEGHTDSDGDAALNLALSVARAEAVVDGLVARHVAAERLYAVGYGESTPIADNATAAGKRLNRRIVIKVLDAPL